MAFTSKVQLISIYPDAHMYITSTFYDGYTINEFTVACHGGADGLLIDGHIWSPDTVAECIQSCTTVYSLHKIHILACGSANYDIASTAAKISSIIRDTEVKGYVGSVYINFRHEEVYQYYLANGNNSASIERYLERAAIGRIHTNNVNNYYCIVFKNGMMERWEALES
ncbi:hypothetical protein [Xenorhabdus bovienii]|uniref:Uncharacterized protein n=2 Tax=Xenorhabdus bovienii TaxID=40576 RepID=A0A077NGY6_XENBV|nr:hypothetical protein [Xenorhabdus bovienii]CDG97717.1 conserved hypothetical protein [Xenorhabdus bovienii str. puntauvense]CDH02779.1 conserved hypothetical protein [Xenorhabdus bovienii str. feltiae Moldova]